MKEETDPQYKNLKEYVNFTSLPNQFTLMVMGEPGLSKSTLINSLFLTEHYLAEYTGQAPIYVMPPIYSVYGLEKDTTQKLRLHFPSISKVRIHKAD
uniref:Septin-type G domain-containing protein n=1 Tax=Oryzias melastigma TaxID=30732 RepID=A0A3B3CBW4_ORYME